MTRQACWDNPIKRPVKNSSLFLYELKKNITPAIVAVCTLLPITLLIFILDIFNLDSNEMTVTFPAAQVLTVIICLVFAIITPCLMFSYINNKRSLDGIHALPVTRKQLFVCKYLAGLTLVLAAPLLNGILVTVVSLISASTSPALYEIAQFFLSAILLTTALYSMMVFFIMCTGTLLDAILLTFAINIIWPLIIVFTKTLIHIYVIGIVNDSLSYSIFVILSPVLRIFSPSDGFTWISAVYWIIFSALFFFVGSVVYAKRRSEAGGRHEHGRPIKLVTELLLSLVVGMGIGLLCQETSNNSVVLLLVGFVISSAVTLLIAEVIASRGLKSFGKTSALYGGLCAIFAVFLIIISTGALGIENRLPKADSIHGVTVSINGNDIAYDQYGDYDRFLSNTVNFTDRQNIDTVVSLNELIISGIKQYRSENLFAPAAGFVAADDGYEFSSDYLSGSLSDYYRPSYFIPNAKKATSANYLSFDVTYRLKNGSVFQRTYQVSVDFMRDEQKALVTSDEYLRQTNIAYSDIYDPSQFRTAYYVDYNTYLYGYYDTYAQNKRSISADLSKAILEAYKTDLENINNAETFRGSYLGLLTLENSTLSTQDVIYSDLYEGIYPYTSPYYDTYEKIQEEIKQRNAQQGLIEGVCIDIYSGYYNTIELINSNNLGYIFDQYAVDENPYNDDAYYDYYLDSEPLDALTSRPEFSVTSPGYESSLADEPENTFILYYAYDVAEYMTPIYGSDSSLNQFDPNLYSMASGRSVKTNNEQQYKEIVELGNLSGDYTTIDQIRLTGGYIAYLPFYDSTIFISQHNAPEWIPEILSHLSDSSY